MRKLDRLCARTTGSLSGGRQRSVAPGVSPNRFMASPALLSVANGDRVPDAGLQCLCVEDEGCGVAVSSRELALGVVERRGAIPARQPTNEIPFRRAPKVLKPGWIPEPDFGFARIRRCCGDDIGSPAPGSNLEGEEAGGLMASRL